MLITFKLVKNTLKFLTCFAIISLFYYSQSHFNSRQQKWTPIKRLRSKSNANQDPVDGNKKLPNMINILIWDDDDTFEFLEKRQTAFIRNDCSFTNCFITMQSNISNNYNFDAIIFNGKKIANIDVDGYKKLPKKRLPHQIYIFAMQGDCVTYPVCAEQFDDYFNMTWTYKLNSDVNWSLFKLLTVKDETVVAPKINVDWTSKFQDEDVLYEVVSHIDNKKFFGVWIYSNCKSQSHREDIVKEIQYESKKHDNIVQIVYECASKECPDGTREDCRSVYDKSSFCLTFEAVLTEDYMSSEIFDAIDNYCLPVVYGGANYSRFLPPYSYIDARKLGPLKTAELMRSLMNDLADLLVFHQWRSSFNIVRNEGYAACDLCEALNKHKHKSYTHFRRWWNPDFKNLCKMRATGKHRLISRTINDDDDDENR